MIVDHYVRLFKVIGSPGFPLDEAMLRERIAVGARRSFHPEGTLRQMVAVAADTQRADELPRVTTRTIVCARQERPAGARSPAGRTRRGAFPVRKLVGIDGMGHDLAPGVVQRLLESLVPHLKMA
jgi:hypothetical protein